MIEINSMVKIVDNHPQHPSKICYFIGYSPKNNDVDEQYVVLSNTPYVSSKTKTFYVKEEDIITEEFV